MVIANLIDDLPIIHLHYKNCVDMGMALLRMQEFYESKKFRGKVFTLDEYIRYASKLSGDGVFSYFGDTAAYNIPGTSIDEFMLKFDTYQMEKDALNIIKSFKITGPYVVIATSEDVMQSDAHSLNHELRHALFAILPEYKKEIMAVLNKHRHKVAFKKFEEKLKRDYHSKVIMDEVHAYVLTGVQPYYKKLPRGLVSLKNDLKEVEKKYVEGNTIIYAKENLPNSGV